MAARHASELELLRFDDEFEGDIRLNEPMARHTTYRWPRSCLRPSE